MRQPGEPTVEELLESIKRVIARADRGEPSATTGGPEARAQTTSNTADPRTGDEPLVTAAVSASLRESMEALAAPSGQAAPAPPAAPNGLEEMVRELLRPALRDWLDRNLPAIVERMVAAEVARIGARPG